MSFRFISKIGKNSLIRSSNVCRRCIGIKHHNQINLSYCTVHFVENRDRGAIKCDSSGGNVTSSGCNNSAWSDKIIYNEILQRDKTRAKVNEERLINIREKIHLSENDSLPKTKCLFLKCMSGDDTENETKTSDNNVSSHSGVHFPYEVQKSVMLESETYLMTFCSNTPEDFKEDIEVHRFRKQEKSNIHIRKVETSGVEPEYVLQDSRFGTADPNVPISSVPCGGCGALLHCTDMSIPGFMPKEVFVGTSDNELRTMTCQRCLFLHEYNVALGINVRPEEYPKIIKSIQTNPRRVLVILIVDLTDYPCSIWPDILSVIGESTPIILVGNKVDLIIQDGDDHLRHLTKSLKDSFEAVGLENANIVHTQLISAKTGYGVEKLIGKINTVWGCQGDIYIVGCTNVGKSTLFNALIQSDLCKVLASDLLQRATVSQWPGTTMNLLKFPLMRPAAWHRALRSQRLKHSAERLEEFRESRHHLVMGHKGVVQFAFMGLIGRSSRNPNVEMLDGIGFDADDPVYKRSKWCYDTPGVVHKSQLINILTTHELSKTLPKTTIIPRNFRMTPGMTLFIAGLARLDFVQGAKPARFTVYASSELPVTVTSTEDAEDVYRELVGTELFVVPSGDAERMAKWPKLSSQVFKVSGVYIKEAAGDIVLSSAGWVSITIVPPYSCTVRAWTPEGRGLYVRHVPAVRYGASYVKGRIKNTPAFEPNIKVLYDTVDSGPNDLISLRAE